jgi:hypothetical protein
MFEMQTMCMLEMQKMCTLLVTHCMQGLWPSSFCSTSSAWTCQVENEADVHLLEMCSMY